MSINALNSKKKKKDVDRCMHMLKLQLVSFSCTQSSTKSITQSELATSWSVFIKFFIRLICQRAWNFWSPHSGMRLFYIPREIVSLINYSQLAPACIDNQILSPCIVDSPKHRISWTSFLCITKFNSYNGYCSTSITYMHWASLNWNIIDNWIYRVE